ncbi:hypothetical protein AAKU55_004498 [Oxalobacteraceae bacterium GrIS 1.11]
MIIAPPAEAPFPIDTFLKPSTEEQSKIATAASTTATPLPCCIPVKVGIFFDGTNNNLERDHDGKRTGLPDPKTKVPGPVASRALKPEEYSHSNVARLFMAFPNKKQTSGYFSYYIPGPGTPFKEIGELTESDDGKAFCLGGQPRIIFGLFQVLNAIYMTVYDQHLLYTAEQAGKFALAYDKEMGREELDVYGQPVKMTHRDWFAPHIAKLTAALAAHPKPSVPSLTLSVFGFSRGAAEAVAFCHFFSQLLDNGKLAGVAASIQFLGVFDTVATVGGSASIAKTIALAPDRWFDGHWGWANEILKPLPDCVKAGQHHIAAHEQRMNFPVTRQGGVDKFKEFYFPGMHSDVGGGYAPGDYGKGRGAQSAMLSQISLAHMFKAARTAGVPLKPFSELEVRVQDDFQVDAKLASAWNAYTAELGKDGHLIKMHMELYCRWRAARLKSLENTDSFKASDPQAQQDLRDSNRMLAGDLEALAYRRKPPPRDEKNRFGPYKESDRLRINQWQFTRAQESLALDDWEQWALALFDAHEPLPAEVMRFFDDYVHDSLAGFYLAGAVTEYDKRLKVASVMKTERPEKLKGFDKRVYEVGSKTKAAQDKKKAGETLTPDEAKLVSEAEYGTPFPIRTDADTADMRSAAITTQTDTRREGGGYIIRRGYYPQSGFFRRKSVNEGELNTAPTPAELRKAKVPEKVAFELIWSDNLRVDIAEANRTDGMDMEKVAAMA